MVTRITGDDIQPDGGIQKENLKKRRKMLFAAECGNPREKDRLINDSSHLDILNSEVEYAIQAAENNKGVDLQSDIDVEIIDLHSC